MTDNLSEQALTDADWLYQLRYQRPVEEWPRLTRIARALAAPTLIFPPDYPAEMTLAACPVGLFMYRDELCLKTEYRTEKGAVEAYIAASGEFFWGDKPQTVESQLGQIVRPVEVASSPPARSEQPACTHPACPLKAGECATAGGRTEPFEDCPSHG